MLLSVEFCDFSIKNRLKHYFITVGILFFVLISNFTFAVDSLKFKFESATDTNKIKYALSLSKRYQFSNYDSAVYYSDQAISDATLNNNQFFLANAINQKGICNAIAGEFKQAKDLFEESLIIFRKLNSEEYIANSLGNIAIIYEDWGNFSKSTALNLEALSLRESIKDSIGISNSLNNLGLLYVQQSKLDEAEMYFRRGIAIDEALGNDAGIASTLNNLAGIFEKKGGYRSAINLSLKSLSKQIELNQTYRVAGTYNNLGEYYHLLSFNDSAHYYLNKSLQIREELGDLRGVAVSLNNIGKLLSEEGKYLEAKALLIRSDKIAEENKLLPVMKQSAAVLAIVYEQLGDFENSLLTYKKYATYKDSLFNESKSKEIGKLEAKYEFEKEQEEQLRLKNEAVKFQQEKKNRRDNLQYSGIMVVVLLLFAFVFMSGKFAVSERFAEGLIFFTFLLFFEFLLVLLDPFIDQWSGGAPALKLVLNALLAALIFPLHAFFESKLKKRLILGKL